MSARGGGRGLGGLRGELAAQRFKSVTVGGTEQAIITHLDKAVGQDVLKKAWMNFSAGRVQNLVWSELVL